MKRLLLAAVALTVVGGTAATAQPYDHDRRELAHDRAEIRHDQAVVRHDHAVAVVRHDNAVAVAQHRRWVRGQQLDRSYWDNRYVVNDWRARRLHAPPPGYYWRRVDNQYVLAAATTGLIAEIISGR